MADEFDIYVMKRKLDKAEKELAEAKVLLRIANETIYELLDCGAACSSRMCDAHCIYNTEDCPLNEMEGTTSCEGIRK